MRPPSNTRPRGNPRCGGWRRDEGGARRAEGGQLSVELWSPPPAGRCRVCGKMAPPLLVHAGDLPAGMNAGNESGLYFPRSQHGGAASLRCALAGWVVRAAPHAQDSLPALLSREPKPRGGAFCCDAITGGATPERGVRCYSPWWDCSPAYQIRLPRYCAWLSVGHSLSTHSSGSTLIGPICISQ
jgi:hypothetical protein